MNIVHRLNIKILAENRFSALASVGKPILFELFTNKNVNSSYIGRLKHQTDSKKETKNELIYKSFQDLLHSSTSYFILMVKKFCKNNERRSQIKAVFKKSLSEADSELITALLLGKDIKSTPISQDIIRKSGVAYIFSLSALYSSVFLLINSPYLWKKFGKIFTTFISLLFIFLFAFLSGCSISNLRKCFSLAILLLAKNRGYRVQSSWLTMIICLVLTFYQPNFFKEPSIQFYLAFCFAKMLYTKFYTKKNRDRIDISSKILKGSNYQSNLFTANVNLFVYRQVERTKVVINNYKKTIGFLFFIQLTTSIFTVWMFSELTVNLLIIVPFILLLTPLLCLIGIFFFLVEPFHIIQLKLVLSLVNFFLYIFRQLIEVSAKFSISTSSLSTFDIFCATLVYLAIIFSIYFNLSRLKKVSNGKMIFCRE